MGRDLAKSKKVMSSLILKYDVVIVILTSQQLRKWKVFIFIVFGWIKPKFGLRGDFRLPISNLKNAVSVRNHKKVPLFFP